MTTRVRAALLVALVWAVAGCSTPPPEQIARVTPTLPIYTAVATTAAPSHWERVLTRLDTVRESAYRRQLPRLLREVYAAGSPVLRRDSRVLQGYARRDISVHGVRLELLRVRFLGRDGDRVRLRVVDRLHRPTALTPGGAVRLPRDLPTRRVVVLERSDGAWRIAAVRRLAG